MVRHLRFSLSLASQPLSQMDHLSFRCLYCASISLGILFTLAWCILSVPWPPLHQIQMLCFFLWRLRSLFSGSSRACLLGVSLVFFVAIPEHIKGYPWRAFLTIYFFGAIIFSGRAPWPCGPLGLGLLVWNRVVSSPHSSHFILKSCLACSRRFTEIGRLDIPAVSISFSR